MRQELYLVHGAENLQLYERVSVPILTEPDLLRRVLLPKYDVLEAQVQQLLLHYIMVHWPTLQADVELIQALADTAFVLVARSGESRRVCIASLINQPCCRSVDHTRCILCLKWT